MSVKVKESYVEQLETPASKIVFDEIFQQIRFPKIPKNYRFQYKWDTGKRKSVLKIQKKCWNFWKTELTIPVEPKGEDLFYLLQEIEEAGSYLAARLDRKILKNIIKNS